MCLLWGVITSIIGVVRLLALQCDEDQPADSSSVPGRTRGTSVVPPRPLGIPGSEDCFGVTAFDGLLLLGYYDPLFWGCFCF